MKLAPGERSILATFADGPYAEAAEAELRQAGYQTVQVDRISRFGRDPDKDLDRPVFGANEGSMSDAVLEPATMDGNSKVLLAAMPNASGMAGPSTQQGANFLITVVTNEQGVERAVSILKKHGGRV